MTMHSYSFDAQPGQNNDRPTLALVSTLLLGPDACPVRFMYRTVQANIRDTGWRLFSGYEDEAFLADRDNLQPYPLEQLIATDPSLLELLQGKPGSVWERVPGADWQSVHDFIIPTEGDEVIDKTEVTDLKRFQSLD